MSQKIIKRGPGRPTDQPLTTRIQIRVTEAQREEFKRRGGSAWLQGLLDEKK